MILHPAQSKIAQDTHRFRVLNCGRRFGKTTLAIEEMKGMALARPSNIAYISPTYQQSRDICWNMLVKELGPIIIKKNESRLELEVMTKDGKTSLISLRGWESVETMRGQSYDFLVIDEVASMRNFWVGWNEVLSPTLLDRKGSVMFISTPKGFNHFFDLYNLQEKDNNYQSFHYTTYDNPNIPVDEIEREKSTKPENTFGQEYLAMFTKQEGLVYKDFDREKHLYDNHTKRGQIIKRIVGVDFGFTNPTCVLLIEIDYDNTYWVASEWYKRGKTNSEIIDYIKTLQIEAIYPDPAEPDRIEEMKRMGLNVQDVSKDIVKGIDSVRQLFKTNKIRIHKDCQNLISEIETYRFEDKKADKNDPEKPVKENDHAMDALRYPLFNTAPIVVSSDLSEFNLYSQSTYD